MERLNEVEEVENVVYDASGNYEARRLPTWLRKFWLVGVVEHERVGDPDFDCHGGRFNISVGLLILILDKTTLIGILKALGFTKCFFEKIVPTYRRDWLLKNVMGKCAGFCFGRIQAIFRVIHLDPVTYYMNTVQLI